MIGLSVRRAIAVAAVAAVTAAASLGACGSSSSSSTDGGTTGGTDGGTDGGGGGLSQYLTSVKSSDGSITAALRSGSVPTGSGPSVQASTAGVIIPGGTNQVTVTASELISRVLVAIQGVDGYYELTGLTPALVQTVLLTIAQSPPPTFSLEVAGGTASAVGAQQAVPVNVTVVGTGDVQVNVSWDVDSDVDLHVLDPSGTEIFYGNTSSSSGGRLDLDSNAGCSLDHKRAENITWPTGQAPNGTYKVLVDYFAACSVQQTKYVVTVNVKGKAPQTFSNTFTGAGDDGFRCFPSSAGDGGTNVSCGTLITTFTVP